MADTQTDMMAVYSVGDVGNVTTNLENTSYHPHNQGPTEGLAGLKAFNDWYTGIHGHLSVFVCILGIVANILNIIVLTRKNMINSVNCILTWLAIADLLTMMSYLPFALYFYCLTGPDETYGHSYNWVAFILFHNCFSITSHTIAMWLTVSLAIFRYIIVCHHSIGPTMCSMLRAKITITAVYISTAIICIPQYISYEITKLAPNKTSYNSTNAYWFVESEIVRKTDGGLLKGNYWLYGVVIKLTPCVLLTVLSILLIIAMRQADKRRQRLLTQGRRAESERTHESNRTTAMLVAIVLFFVITELPQGILAMLSGISNYIFINVYVMLADIMDMLILLNSAANFIMYCIMSRQFRNTFKEVILKPCIQKLQKVKQKTNNGVTYNSVHTNNVTTQMTLV
ncbi:unnamed protein product [Owenia fusiformis]|uniref:Uncharacterized protein n=1 Tax=Owenia fusiformis TaxID=6347 RepID=A0A8J1XEZ7_OWEFU|nr:unnamed protein product [Owenia fusiformis]